MTQGYSYAATRRAADDTPARFISLAYNHLFGAILAFAAIQAVLFQTGWAISIAQAFTGTRWLFVFSGYLLVNWIAIHVAHTEQSLTSQYLALAGVVVAEAIIFVPILVSASHVAPGGLSSAALVTTLGFAGLTGIAFVMRKDFSFLRGILMWGGIVALVLIVAGVIFGFQFGTLFSVTMLALAGASVLGDTSNVIHHFPEDRYVAASLELFSSAVFMFWYVLRLFIMSVLDE
jgi:FtsH-binding integral membrane protein